MKIVPCKKKKHFKGYSESIGLGGKKKKKKIGRRNRK